MQARKVQVNCHSQLIELFNLIQESSTASILKKKIICEHQNLYPYLGCLLHYHVLSTVPPETQPRIFSALANLEKIEAFIFQYVKENLNELRVLTQRDHLATIYDVKNIFTQIEGLGEGVVKFNARYKNLKLASFLYGCKVSNGLRSLKKIESDQAIPATVIAQSSNTPAMPNSSVESNIYLKSLNSFYKAWNSPMRFFCESKPTGCAQKVISHQNILDMYPTEEIDKLIVAIQSSLVKCRETLITFLHLDDQDDYCVSIWQGIILKTKAIELLEDELSSRQAVSFLPQR